MTEGVLLDVRDLTKRFGGLTVLDQVSFSLAAGEVAGGGVARATRGRGGWCAWCSG